MSGINEGGCRPVSPASHVWGVTMLERERELAVCTAALQRAVRGAGGLIAVEGPPGIGKTELVRAVRVGAAGGGVRVLAARGLEVEREVAFGGVRQLLEPVLRPMSPAGVDRVFSGAATPSRQLFEAAAVDPITSADVAFAMSNALYWVLARLADARPLLVAVDDAQWMDESSMRFLQFLLPRIDELRTLVLVATHPPAAAQNGSLLGPILADPSARVIRLGPLSPSAVAELVRDRLGGDPDPSFAEACVDVTAGNPFYVVELLRELAEQGTRPGAAEADLVRTVSPRSISLVLRVRVARIGGGTQIAGALAVLGDGARLDHVAELAGIATADAVRVADSLTRQSILTSGSELSFAHPILGTAVYTDLGPHQRAQMHARAARLLSAAGAPIDRVAAHLMRAEPAADRWVSATLRTAAAAAHAQGAPETAASYLRRALLEPPDTTTRPAVLLELGSTEASTAHPDATRHLTAALGQTTDPAARAEAALRCAPVLSASGHVDEALVMLEAALRAISEVGDGDRDRQLQLQAELIGWAMVEPSAGSRFVPRLAQIDETLLSDSPGARMMLCLLASWRAWRARDASRAADLAERGLAGGTMLAEKGPEAMQFSQAALTLVCADHLGPAAELISEGHNLAQKHGSRYGWWVASYWRSNLAYRRGALADAEADARVAVDITRSADVVLGTIAATSTLIDTLLERGELAEAVDALRGTRFAQGEVPPQALFALLLAARGRLRLAGGDLDGGLADLLECGRRNDRLELRNSVFAPWRADAALAHRARGELDAARALADEELAVARDWGTAGTIGSAHRLAGLLSSGDEAISLLSEAAHSLAASPARLEYARALVDLGAALRRANHRVAAREPLMRGLDLADRCGAIVLRQRAHAELAAIGAHPRRRRLTGIDGLTASELRVARMAASGLGNLEIAQQLFVTRKTIEKHLGNAYLKLGVNSRDALSAKVGKDTPLMT
jgi:DNA-binding CsgD family transcriptional regulator